MAELVVRVPGEPFAQPRHRSAPLMKNGRPVLGKNGRPIMIEYDPKRAKSWKASAMHFMMNAKFEHDGQLGLVGPVALSVLAVFTCPKSDVRKRDPRPRRWHTKRPDGDNVLKAVKDAAKGVLWLDDSQVAHAMVTKIVGAQGEAPYVEIRVMELPEGGLSVVLRDGMLFHEELLQQGGDAQRPSSTPLGNEAPAGADSPGSSELPLFERRD